MWTVDPVKGQSGYRYLFAPDGNRVAIPRANVEPKSPHLQREAKSVIAHVQAHNITRRCQFAACLEAEDPADARTALHAVVRGILRRNETWSIAVQPGSIDTRGTVQLPFNLPSGSRTVTKESVQGRLIALAGMPTYAERVAESELFVPTTTEIADDLTALVEHAHNLRRPPAMSLHEVQAAMRTVPLGMLEASDTLGWGALASVEGRFTPTLGPLSEEGGTRTVYSGTLAVRLEVDLPPTVLYVTSHTKQEDLIAAVHASPAPVLLCLDLPQQVSYNADQLLESAWSVIATHQASLLLATKYSSCSRLLDNGLSALGFRLA